MNKEIKTSFTLLANVDGSGSVTFNSPIQVIGTFPAGAIQGSVDIGVLPATINGGTGTLDEEVDASVLMGGSLTASDNGLVTLLTPHTNLSVTLPLTASVGTYNADTSGTPTLTISDSQCVRHGDDPHG